MNALLTNFVIIFQTLSMKLILSLILDIMAGTKEGRFSWTVNSWTPEAKEKAQ